MVLMPTDAHEGLLALFREHPELLPQALDELLALFPGASAITVTASSEGLTQRSLELRPDGVWLLERSKVERWVVVVEVQRAIDRRKLKAWPLYEWAARRKYDCPALVLVVTPHAHVARWAAEPILTPSGGSFRALVLSPVSEAPALEVERATKAPARAVLSAMLQGQADPELAVQVATVAAEAVRELPEAQARLYLDLIEASLSAEALERWEEQMSQPGYVWKSAFALKHRDEGREEGRAAAIRELVARLLAARFGPLPDWASERLREAELEDVERWSLRLVSADRLEDIFVASK